MLADQDYSTYSDLHKDVYGFRPRGVTFATPEDYDAEFARLVKELELKEHFEEQDDVRLRAQFETHIAELMNTHNIDQATAIRWDMQAMDADAAYGLEHYFWQWGFNRFGAITREFEEAVNVR